MTRKNRFITDLSTGVGADLVRDLFEAGIALAKRSYRLIFLAGLLLPLHAVANENTDSTPPRVMRYLSMLDDFAGQSCFGLVLTDRDGIPERVYNLGSEHTSLCVDSKQTTAVTQLRLALDTAETVAAQHEHNTYFIETLAQDRLAGVVQSPVEISQQQLDAGQRYIIGVGLNYREHRKETGAQQHVGLAPDELLVFPKVVAPTGAYAGVQAGARIGLLPVQRVRLLDYEVELGMVLLDDLDLNALPDSYAEFINSVAFFTANDVSDRGPIILDSEFGYTRGKSHPGYLPAGPWMVHGRHLQPAAPGEGRQPLELGLVVQEPARGDRVAWQSQLQSASSANMILGPWRIVQLLAARQRQGIRGCMRDADGVPRYTYSPAGVIPAGSIILTGTPGGTALQAPDTLEKLVLFLRGGFSVTGARQRMIKDSVAHIGSSRYLEPGNYVETSISMLGRQRWIVLPNKTPDRYGVAVSGDCSIVTGIESND